MSHINMKTETKEQCYSSDVQQRSETEEETIQETTTTINHRMRHEN